MNFLPSTRKAFRTLSSRFGRRLNITSAVVAAASLSALAPSAHAQIVYTTIDGVGESVLRLYGLTSATTTVIGQTRVNGALPIVVTALASDPISGQLFGVTNPAGFFYPGSLVKINPFNGVATVVGKLEDATISDIAFSPGGVLYGWNTTTGLTAIINTDTARVQTLGNRPFFEATVGGGFAITANGNLYVSSKGANGALRQISAADGSFTTVANIGGTPYPTASIRAMTASATALYALNLSADENDPPVLVTLNTGTAAATTVTNLAQGAVGLASVNFFSLPQFSTAPSGLNCVPGSKQVTCSFTPPVPDGNPLPTNFVLRCAATTGPAAFYTVSSTTSPITIRNMAGSTLHYCSIASVNANGEGRGSDLSAVSTYSPLAGSGSPDTNGDGRSEFFMTAGLQTLRQGFLNASNSSLVFGQKLPPSGDFRVLGTGDFAGIFRSALVIQNGAGDVRMCFDVDCGPDTNQFVRNVKLTWTLESIADFDGDGKSDFLWRYALPNTPDTGAMFIWFMNGASISEIKVRGGAPLSWRILGAPDINGDNVADIVLQSPSGDIRVLLGGPNRSFANQLIGRVPPGFTAVKAANFTGGEKADVLLRNAATGDIALWVLDGAQVASQVSLPSTDPTWSYFASGDYDGDGTYDIIWMRPDRTLVMYLMQKTTPGQPVVINVGTAPTDFSVILP